MWRESLKNPLIVGVNEFVVVRVHHFISTLLTTAPPCAPCSGVGPEVSVWLPHKTTANHTTVFKKASQHTCDLYDEGNLVGLVCSGRDLYMTHSETCSWIGFFCFVRSSNIALTQLTWVVGQMYVYILCLTVSICCILGLCNCMTSTYCLSAGSFRFVCLWVWPTAQLECWICLPVVTAVLSVSFCLSDGCEGQSLLAVSQNGLSLSLASLFSGICRLTRLCSCIQFLLAALFWEGADGSIPNWGFPVS